MDIPRPRPPAALAAMPLPGAGALSSERAADGGACAIGIGAAPGPWNSRAAQRRPGIGRPERIAARLPADAPPPAKGRHQA
ncbi:hypothetical protein [Azohydromonas caseinilytica]|uniref:Uncharacterized protein n=1 Tax=Azohydromonas caseinilytica TaxID=2728836 RepID=A0A848FI05_9BURK|nr:hypothetical protein [Azohydromonas caseinilytica]NML18495.1 hypothetical protein [Azohydromonas caseinilytica]